MSLGMGLKIWQRRRGRGGGDTTAPVVSSISYDDPTTTIDATIVEASGAATCVWATADPATDPTYTVGGGWVGTTYETGSFAVTTGANSDTITLTATTPDGSRELTVYYYDADSNTSTPAERLAVTVSNAFAPTWMQFDGAVHLYKSGDLTGIPSTTQDMLIAMTYSPNSTDVSTTVNLISGIASVDKVVTMDKGSTGQVDWKTEDNADTLAFRAGSNLSKRINTAGEKFLLLYSVEAQTAGPSSVHIDLSNGTVYNGVVTTDTAPKTLSPPSSSGWLIASANAAGLLRPEGQIERVQVWFGTSADALLTATQAFFVDGSGSLENPTVAVAQYGTAIIDISGTDLATGTNAGSGGDFVKTGTGAITEA